jgi:hypothetical protein
LRKATIKHLLCNKWRKTMAIYPAGRLIAPGILRPEQQQAALKAQQVAAVVHSGPLHTLSGWSKRWLPHQDNRRGEPRRTPWYWQPYSK